MATSDTPRVAEMIQAVESPGERRLSAVAEKFDLTDEQVMELGRRYADRIEAMRSARGRSRAQLLREFGEWLALGDGVAA